MNEEDLRKAFEAFGEVNSLNIIKDKFSGVSKGFAFMEIEAKLKAQEAIQDLNGTELKGTHIVVNEARPKSDKPRDGGKRW